MTDTPTTTVASRTWWLPLITGLLWLLFAFFVLSFDVRTVYAVAAFFGVGLLVGGVTDLAIASAAEEGRWVHIVLGVIEIGGGVIALAWPGQTFLVLANLVGWFLLLVGLVDVVMALATRRVNELWWLGLLVGLLAVGVGLWAIGYEGRSIAVLVFWVGATALVRGFSQIVLAFGVRQADRELSRYLAR